VLDSTNVSLFSIDALDQVILDDCILVKSEDALLLALLSLGESSLSLRARVRSSLLSVRIDERSCGVFCG
jgi:hypothetical protein